MTEPIAQLRTVLATVRQRWTRRAVLRAWTLGAGSAAAMLLVGVLTVWLVAREGWPLVFAVAAVLAMAAVSLVFALLPFRRPPTDRQVARLIEEQAGGLHDVVATAIEQGARADRAIAAVLVEDALRALRSVDLDLVVSRDTMGRAAAGAAVGTAAMIAAFIAFAPSVDRAGDVIGAHVFPARYAVVVSPGSVKVRAGQPLTITARLTGTSGGIVPTLTVGTGEAARSAPMTPGRSADEFTITLNNLSDSFPYVVAAGAVQSEAFIVDVVRPVRLTRIDLSFAYPKGTGLAAHVEEDGGDIYAPAGTRVRLSVTADKPLAQAGLTLADGRVVPLTGVGATASAELVITRDSSYRVSLSDHDGLSSDPGTEYFIRMLNDRPPDVRILRPAGDKQVSPLEEVAIEARADDDYGLASLELVLKTSAGRETVVPLGDPVSGAAASGQHTVFLEDLRVTPGDFVTYYARARDRGRGRRPAEARSDIYFLEVKPYEEEFVASDSQAGVSQGPQTGVEELVAMQKDIIAATWKLDARGRRGGETRSAQDIRAVGQAQSALRARAEEAAGEIANAAASGRRRRPQPGMLPGDDPMARAMAAMGRAAGELDRLSTATALPYEEEALSQLLKAAAEIRRRQIQRQQAQGRGGNGNRLQPDLSTLFDQELRKKQQTNYETPSTGEQAGEQPAQAADPLSEIRDLARRQDALAREQQELAAKRDQIAAEELARQLQRLTREQNELREQLDALSKQGEASRPQDASGTAGAGGSAAESRRMREISDEMRNAARELARQDPAQAGARAERALEQLRGLEEQMQGARPDERRRAIGDLQLEARQLAEAERRLGREAAAAGTGAAGEDARRRLAAEQERLAARADRLGDGVKRLAASPDPAAAADGEDGRDRRQAITAASREIDQQRPADRMREAAAGMRAGAERAAPATEDVARGLDKVAEQLALAGGSGDGEATRLSQQLGRTQELRDRLQEVQRGMEQLGQAGEPGATGDGAGEVARLRQEVDRRMQEAERLAGELRRQAPEAPSGTTPEQWQRSTSAPGTEAFKQDFAKWESLKASLLATLERSERQLSDQLRQREQQQRLNAGGHEAVADSYRELVERYYQSLSAPRRPRR